MRNVVRLLAVLAIAGGILLSLLAFAAENAITGTQAATLATAVFAFAGVALLGMIEQHLAQLVDFQQQRNRREWQRHNARRQAAQQAAAQPPSPPPVAGAIPVNPAQPDQAADDRRRQFLSGREARNS